MNATEKQIYNDISSKILNFFQQNEIKYNMDDEKKQIKSHLDSLSSRKAKADIITTEQFSCRTIALLNCLEKMVLPIPRKVLFSKHLLKKMDTALPRDIVKKINTFDEKFELGQNINSNLSKQIFNSNSWDYILNIWNIRHLHLSESVAINKTDISKNRSDYLLFL